MTNIDSTPQPDARALAIVADDEAQSAGDAVTNAVRSSADLATVLKLHSTFKAARKCALERLADVEPDKEIKHRRAVTALAVRFVKLSVEMATLVAVQEGMQAEAGSPAARFARAWGARRIRNLRAQAKRRIAKEARQADRSNA
jgi:hypothetical protein